MKWYIIIIKWNNINGGIIFCGCSNNLDNLNFFNWDNVLFTPLFDVLLGLSKLDYQIEPNALQTNNTPVKLKIVLYENSHLL